MKSIKAAVTGTVVAALAGGGLLFATSAAASTPPAYAPDANSTGGITFYNAAGAVITGGTDLTHLFDYAAASSGPTGGRVTTKGQTIFSLPDHTKPSTTTWTNFQASAATNYPVASAPGALASVPATNPVATAGATEANLSNVLAVASLDNTAGYANIMQVRLKDSGAGVGNGVIAAPYWSADIMFNQAQGTWSQVNPVSPMFTTVSTITPSIASPAPNGSTVNLTATVAAVDNSHPAGSVHLFDGATDLGAATFTAGTGAISKSVSPATGSYNYKFVFTPTDSSSATGYTSASSATLPYTVSPPAPAADTKTLVSGSTTGTTGISQIIHADVQKLSDSSALPAAAGSVQFTVDGTNSGAPVTLTATGANFSYTPADTAPHTIKAAFTPANPALYNPSADTTGVTVTATAPLYTPDPQPFDVNVQAGTLVISTPYTVGNPFHLGNLVLNGAGTQFATALVPFGDPAAPAVTDPGTAGTTTNGVTITDTRAASTGWTASAQTTDFTQGPNSIDGNLLSFTSVTPKYLTGNHLQAGSVTTNDITAFGSVKKSFATTTQGPGTVAITGFMSMTAPTSTVAGLYTATVTFTIV